MCPLDRWSPKDLDANVIDHLMSNSKTIHSKKHLDKEVP